MSKPFFNLLLLVLLVSGLMSACSHTGTRSAQLTNIKLSTAEIELGTIAINTLKETQFSITNTGETPLTIYRVATSCGCTEVEWKKKPLRPGKTTDVQVKYKDNYPGFIRKTITVYGNIAKPMVVNLTGELIE